MKKKKYLKPETEHRTVLLEGTICSSATVLNPNAEKGKIDPHEINTDFSKENDFSQNSWEEVE